MSDETVIIETAGVILPNATRKVSVTFERKKDLGNYENVVARAWVESNVPEDATASQVAEALQDLFVAAAAAVLDQLGIEAILDDTGTLREKFTPAITEKAKSDLVSRSTGVDFAIKVMNPAESEANGPLPDGMIEWAKTNGIKAVWDQRHQADKKWAFREAIPRGEDRKPKLWFAD